MGQESDGQHSALTRSPLKESTNPLLVFSLSGCVIQGTCYRRSRGLRMEAVVAAC
jgi:hypothetical protein